MIHASLVIGAYNQAKTLALLFQSLSRQTELGFEVWVADDGSEDATAQLCDSGSSHYGFPIQRVFQPNLGFRKAKILNEAIRKTQADYVIFVDADVVVERHFVEDHLNLKKADHFVCGRRVDLGPLLSQWVTPEAIASGQLERLSWKLLRNQGRGEVYHGKRSLRIPFRWLRWLLGYERPLDLLGSNFSVWKQDLFAVNGFNEAYQRYWGEDGDLYARLIHSQKKSINAKGLCIQYHLFHPRRKSDLAQWEAYQQLLKDPHYRWADQGLVSNSDQ